jgi:hypothetical protein
VSRFGRFQNVDEGAYYEQILKRAGAPVVYCAEPFTGEEASLAVMFKTVKRAMAAEFSRELSERVRAGQRASAMAGRWHSVHAGYAFRKVLIAPDGREHPCPPGRVRMDGFRTELRHGPADEIATVRRIFNLYVRDRKSIKSIAIQMTTEGRPPPGVRGWPPTTVAYILSNEKYCGAMVYGRTRSELRRLVGRTSPATWTRHEATYPPIVSRAAFDAAAAIRRGRAPRPGGELLEGLRRLHTREGVVTQWLIDGDKALPSCDCIIRRFGSIAAASRLAGLPSLTPMQTRDTAAALGKLRNRTASVGS